jgi:hypothetical protein
MPRGPKGEKRPADVIGAAIMVAKIATGEVVEQFDTPPQSESATLGRKGGRARAAKLSAQERRKIAKQAAAKRWEAKK